MVGSCFPSGWTILLDLYNFFKKCQYLDFAYFYSIITALEPLYIYRRLV